MKSNQYLRRFAAYYKPFRGMLMLDMGASLLICVIDLVYPLMTRSIINDVVPNRNLRQLILFGAILLVVFIARFGLNFFVNYYGHMIGVRMQGNMRRDIFAHLQKLPFKFFDENQSGALMSRVVNDLQDISELAHHGPELFFLSILLMVGSFVVLATVNLWLTLIIFAFLPIFIFFMYRMQRDMEHGFTESRKTTAAINAELQNSLTGIRVAKAFDSETTELRKFDGTVEAYRSARAIAFKAMGRFHSGMTFFVDLMGLVVLVAGGLFFYFDKINIGDYALFLLNIGQFITPVRRLMQFFEMYEEGKTGFKRFCEIMDEQPEAERPDAADAGDLSGDIVFGDVCFTYGSEKGVLNHLNLVIPNGKKIALVGPSGGGKTTLCQLLPRFYDLVDGSITIDGKNIEWITRSSLRRNMGIVQQEVFLFSGTIAENIGYAFPDAPLDAIVDAAKRAHVHEFVETLENGYETTIGERGVKLSGGQKQRIAIARIFLKNPQILILDEATSALDNVTETQLQQALDALCVGRTSIVVAHRLSTVRNADEIVVLTDDGIAEQGTHADLLALGGIYTELYNTQFSE